MHYQIFPGSHPHIKGILNQIKSLWWNPTFLFASCSDSF